MEKEEKKGLREGDGDRSTERGGGDVDVERKRR